MLQPWKLPSLHKWPLQWEGRGVVLFHSLWPAQMAGVEEWEPSEGSLALKGCLLGLDYPTFRVAPCQPQATSQLCSFGQAWYERTEATAEPLQMSHLARLWVSSNHCEKYENSCNRKFWAFHWHCVGPLSHCYLPVLAFRYHKWFVLILLSPKCLQSIYFYFHAIIQLCLILHIN